MVEGSAPNPSTTAFGSGPPPQPSAREELNASKPVRRADQTVKHAGLAEQMAPVGDDVELDLWPRLLELPCGDGRRAGVVPALDDRAGNALELHRVAQQLAFLQPTVVRHVMILDPRHGD